MQAPGHGHVVEDRAVAPEELFAHEVGDDARDAEGGETPDRGAPFAEEHEHPREGEPQHPAVGPA